MAKMHTKLLKSKLPQINYEIIYRKSIPSVVKPTCGHTAQIKNDCLKTCQFGEFVVASTTFCVEQI